MNNKKIIILGSNGQLGQTFQQELKIRGSCFFAPDKTNGDITNFPQIEYLIQKESPDIIINCAAYNAVDDAQDNSEKAYLVNSKAVEHLALLCKKNNIFFIHYSSDYVFDGTKGDLYTEEDIPNPLNIYGQSKLDGEKVIQNVLTNFLIFRLSWVIGPGKQNFLYKLTQWAKNNSELKVSNDEISVPTFTQDIVDVTFKSLEQNITGLYHLTNTGKTSRYALAEYFIKTKKMSNTIIPVPMNTFPTKAKRPRCSAMSNQKISEKLNINIPTWQERINNYV